MKKSDTIIFSDDDQYTITFAIDDWPKESIATSFTIDDNEEGSKNK